MKNYVKTIVDLLFNFGCGLLLGYLLLLPFGISPMVMGAAFVALTLISFAYSFYTGRSFLPRFLLYAGLLKEIWISRLMEKFYPTAPWLERAQDYSGVVENNTINLAEIGADPQVLVNNSSYPVPFADRTDVPLQLPLDYYDTEGTVVRNAEAIQLDYPKMDTVISQHGKALAKAQSAKAAWNYAPAAANAYNSIILCEGYPGANYAAGARKPFSFKKLIDAKLFLDSVDAPLDGRVFVLHPTHQADLLNQDVNLFKGFTDYKSGMIGQLYGFDIYTSTQCPTYNGTNNTKNAYGAAAANTDVISSFFFLDTEVMRAKGTMDMFSRLRDPEARGDIVGFQQRFVALSIRNKWSGAILDYTVPAI
jgi:hypothetical protein